MAIKTLIIFVEKYNLNVYNIYPAKINLMLSKAYYALNVMRIALCYR